MTTTIRQVRTTAGTVFVRATKKTTTIAILAGSVNGCIHRPWPKTRLFESDYKEWYRRANGEEPSESTLSEMKRMFPNINIDT